MVVQDDSPKTKEDILWIPYDCDNCGITTNYMQGQEPGCVKCADDIYNDAMDGMVGRENDADFHDPIMAAQEAEIRNFDRPCLQEHLNTDDPESIETIRQECAALGCNICLSQTTNDDILWPKHYNSGKIQPIDVIEDWKLDFRLANAVKYIGRQGKKDPTQAKKDLEKAIWYIERFIEKELN